jgi:hypothetical protein
MVEQRVLLGLLVQALMAADYQQASLALLRESLPVALHLSW